VNGNVETLQVLFNFIKTIDTTIEQHSDKIEFVKKLDKISFVLLQQLLYWTRVGATLVASKLEGDPQLCDQVGDYILAKISQIEEVDKDNDEYTRVLWSVAIHGLHVFYRTPERQFKFFFLLLEALPKYRIRSSELKRNDILNYHYYKDSLNLNLTPMQLFNICYFKYPRAFFHRSIMICSEINEYSFKFK
jgi:hypothetical protein